MGLLLKTFCSPTTVELYENRCHAEGVNRFALLSSLFPFNRFFGIGLVDGNGRGNSLDAIHGGPVYAVEKLADMRSEPQRRRADTDSFPLPRLARRLSKSSVRDATNMDCYPLLS